MHDQLTIGELSARTGLAPSALRYYEELDLIRPARRVSGQRRYAESTVELVGMILLLCDVGFSLTEAKALLVARSRSPKAWRELARRKIGEIDRQIAAAKKARVAIQHAVRCRHADVLACPNFAQVLAARLAGKSLAESHSH